jgi:hypothetical protein
VVAVSSTVQCVLTDGRDTGLLRFLCSLASVQ